MHGIDKDLRIGRLNLLSCLDVAQLSDALAGRKFVQIFSDFEARGLPDVGLRKQLRGVDHAVARRFFARRGLRDRGGGYRRRTSHPTAGFASPS